LTELVTELVAGLHQSDSFHGVDRQCALPGGRVIAYREFGAPDGDAVLAFHGTPGSRLKFASAHRAAVDRHQRLISIDRWGYGGTTRHPAPGLDAFGRDMGEFLDALSISQAAVIGVSGGGPFAAAAAAVLGARVCAMALVAPVGEFNRPANTPRELSAFHSFCFRVLPRVPGAVRLVFAPLRAAAILAPGLAAIMATRRAGKVDRTLMRNPAHRRGLGEAFRAGLLWSSQGAVTDMMLFSRRWDIDPSKIQCPAKVWIGSADRNVPVKAAISLAHRIGTCELEVLKGGGHFWIVENFSVVLDWTRGQAPR